MALGESSFDVVSQFDRMELVNAIDQATKEIHTRYDLKDSGSTIELEASLVKLHSASEMTLDAVRDVLLQRAVKRQLSPKVFDYGKVEDVPGGVQVEFRVTVEVDGNPKPACAAEILFRYYREVPGAAAGGSGA